MKTKEFIWGLFFVFISDPILSQQYDSLVVENAQWRVEYIDNNTPWPDTMFGWLIRGDTIVNNTQYKKVYRRKFEDFNSNVITEQVLHGVMREDVDNKLVYAIEFSAMSCEYTGIEFLLFDFSQGPGDSLSLCSTNGMDPPILNSTYYLYEFGKERKIFDYHPSPVDNFIEGIGHFAGLFESPVTNVSSETGYALFDYCRGTDEECGVVYVQINSLVIPPSLVVYPNPCYGLFYIKSLKNEMRFISLSNTYGQECQVIITRVDECTLRIETQQRGLLLLRIRNESIENNIFILSID